MATTHGVIYVLELQSMAPQRALPPAKVRCGRGGQGGGGA